MPSPGTAEGELRSHPAGALTVAHGGLRGNASGANELAAPRGLVGCLSWPIVPQMPEPSRHELFCAAFYTLTGGKLKGLMVTTVAEELGITFEERKAPVLHPTAPVRHRCSAVFMLGIEFRRGGHGNGR